MLGLVSIQYYLIRNSYFLQKKEYIAEVKKSVSPVIYSDTLDYLHDSLASSIQNLILETQRKRLTHDDLNTVVLTKIDSIRLVGNQYLKDQESAYPILKEVHIRFQFTELMLQVNGITDSIVKPSEEPIVLFGTTLDNSSFEFSSNNFNTIYDDDELYEMAYWGNYRVYVDIRNWQQQVLFRMFWMLLAATILILAEVILFYAMYKALLKQKKIAELKTDFANNITHELKTPIASISLISKSLRNDELVTDKDKRVELLDTLERQNMRMQYIADKVLESAMEQKVDKTAVDISELLQTIVADFNAEECTLSIDLVPLSYVLNTDVFLLQRVVYNLLENAKKYSGDNKTIELKGFVEGEFYVISVKDYGVGITKKEHKKIFDKFYRVPKGYEHQVKGLGLGLYLSKQMIDQLGGTINVVSEPGNGSTFIIKIAIE
ncbi:two-component sensor histidine kinase [Neptunitalea chrysea]|uniref:histidine kinase n=1 Tax=Neptunitalea chrysea TaxID=1647581 RepID=A0A9W6EWA5_9FLAO|nr:two-component sensor histidine kinase [Neptunitalea chrysea]